MCPAGVTGRFGCPCSHRAVNPIEAFAPARLPIRAPQGRRYFGGHRQLSIPETSFDATSALDNSSANHVNHVSHVVYEVYVVPSVLQQLPSPPRQRRRRESCPTLNAIGYDVDGRASSMPKVFSKLSIDLERYVVLPKIRDLKRFAPPGFLVDAAEVKSVFVFGLKDVETAVEADLPAGVRLD